MNLFLITAILTFLVGSVYLYLKWQYSYWKRKGVPYIEPEFLFGNFKDLNKGQIALGDLLTKFYNDFKSKGHKYGGFYGFVKPTFLPVDLELIKCILQKDFGHFVNHGLFFNEEDDPLSGHLFNLEDEKWRKLRAKLTPTFTSGKMKMMFKIIAECSKGLKTILEENSKFQDPVDIYEVVSRFSTDVIGSCAFGIECNSLKDPNAEFRLNGKKIFEVSPFGRSKALAFIIFPREFLRKLRLKQTDPDVEKFFMRVVKDSVEYREKNNVHRPDFLQLLIELKNNEKIGNDEVTINENEVTSNSNVQQSLTMNELAAQCFVFFSAGYETSSTTVTFALLELALNQDVQEKLREEINNVLEKYNGEISYDSVMQMSYLDYVVHETLRKHVPFPAVPRECNKDYKIPGSDFVLKRGSRIIIPIQPIHRDPEYYPDPEKFNPERFNEENKHKIPPYAFLPFGEGPRMCIGLRFGLLQSKIAILTIIKDFEITMNKKTKMPIKYITKNIVNAVDGGVWLNANKI